MKRIAIIPARGGSKRLPRKNVLQFMGKPMLIWTCEAARDSGLFDRIVVSTEDSEIAGVAASYGYDVAERPAHLATDTASVVDVCHHMLESLAAGGEEYDILCALYATAPLRTADDIREVVGLLERDGADYAHAMVRFSLPPHQAMYVNDAGYCSYAWPLVAGLKSQHVPEAVVDNGSTYAARVSEFMKTRKFSGMRLKGYLMPAVRSVDIDTREDYEMALLFAKHLASGDCNV
ncbi:acylneuraminate cytidylyltransferase family protein [Oleidesulfovibrio alaskensis]|jgi:CMP-N-acetylneuraminic acid synthetase